MHAICAKITQKVYAVTITIGFYTKGKLACEVWLHQQQLGRLSNSKHRWATPPHYHHKHTVSISTSEQATSRKHKEPCTHPQSALTAGMVFTTQNFEHKYTPLHPRQRRHYHVEEPCLRYPPCHFPTMCHSNTPTKNTLMHWLGANDTRCQPIKFPHLVT